jgi:hypothetical protein
VLDDVDTRVVSCLSTYLGSLSDPTRVSMFSNQSRRTWSNVTVAVSEMYSTRTAHSDADIVVFTLRACLVRFFLLKSDLNYEVNRWQR